MTSNGDNTWQATISPQAGTSATLESINLNNTIAYAEWALLTGHNFEDSTQDKSASNVGADAYYDLGFTSQSGTFSYANGGSAGSVYQPDQTTCNSNGQYTWIDGSGGPRNIYLKLYNPN